MVSISSKLVALEFSGLGGGGDLLLGGLHLTCDVHFRTQMSYSCHKSCVKNLVWIG